MAETITYNNNQHLKWYRFDCYEYGILNQDPDKRPINVLIVDEDGYSLDVTVAYLETAKFTLPGDGVFDITVTVLENGEELEVTVYEDIFVEFCGLMYCYTQLLASVYCKDCTNGRGLAGKLIGDPCAKLCTDKGLSGKAAGENDYTALRLALVQLNAMLFVYLTHVFEYQVAYMSFDVQPAMRAVKASVVKKIWKQIKAFTESCGFDCTSGADGSTKTCSEC